MIPFSGLCNINHRTLGLRSGSGSGSGCGASSTGGSSGEGSSTGCGCTGREGDACFSNIVW